MNYAEARGAHIAAAAQTPAGRVKRPGATLIGKLAPVVETFKVEGLAPWQHRTAQRIAWRVTNESRQVRRAQDRKEDAQ